jgi:hypothetical protein
MFINLSLGFYWVLVVKWVWFIMLLFWIVRTLLLFFVSMGVTLWFRMESFLSILGGFEVFVFNFHL